MVAKKDEKDEESVSGEESKEKSPEEVRNDFIERQARRNLSSSSEL